MSSYLEPCDEEDPKFAGQLGLWPHRNGAFYLNWPTTASGAAILCVPPRTSPSALLRFVVRAERTRRRVAPVSL